METNYNNITFETERLILRRIKRTDAKAFYDIMGNPDTMQFLGKVLSNDEIKGFIDSVSKSVYNNIDGDYAIVLKENNKVIGMFSIKTKLRDKRAEISYMLNSKYWKKGYMIETISRLLYVLFIEKKMNKITADCDVKNEGSVAILKKIGMNQEGLLKQERFSHILNGYYDVAVFGLLSKDYNSLN